MTSQPQQRITPEWDRCFNLLLDPDVSEIETNGPDLFFMKKKGKRIHLDEIKLSEEAYWSGIESSLVPLVKQFNTWDRDEGYLFEGPLEFRVRGQRVKGRTHIVLPPATDLPQITIAKKSTSLITLDSIAERGSMSIEMKQFLEMAVRGRLTIAFSGGTGAGKTTMMEAVSKLIPMDTRIGVAEDTPELELLQKNVSYLHSVPWQPGLDPNKVATLDWAVAQFNRMRTDMLIIGETRGKEFASFLVAANSGMEGCMTTLHANSPTRCLEKMTNFALKGSERQPIRSVNTDIANALDLIVQLIILPDGRHKVSEIREITNTVGTGEDASITTEYIFKYDETNDVFEKVSHMTDALRKKLTAKGVPIEGFLKIPPGAKLKPHSGAGGVNTPPSQDGGLPRGGGLPIPGQSRSI